jgi:glycosyltransferase involved in cell wall biosynthesis
MRASYSGPTVFMSRLFGRLARQPHLEISALGAELPASTSAAITFIKLKVPNLLGMRGQLSWAGKASRWLITNRDQYDIVHFHGAYTFNLAPALIALLLGKPFTLLPLSAAGDLNRDARTNQIPFIASIKRFIISRSTKAFALSNKNASELQSWGLAKNRIVPLANPASDKYFSRPAYSGNGPWDLVFVGKISEGKRPKLIIEALSQLINQGWKNVNLTLVGPFGSVEDEEETKELVCRLGVDHAVTFTGYVKDPSRVLSDLSNPVFVLPSAQEGLPGALVESMAMGFPSIVTDVGSMGDVIRDSRSGHIIEPHAEAIVTALRDIWANEENWLKLGMAAFSYASRYFSEDAVATTYLASLEESCD